MAGQRNNSSMIKKTVEKKTNKKSITKLAEVGVASDRGDGSSRGDDRRSTRDDLGIGFGSRTRVRAGGCCRLGVAAACARRITLRLRLRRRSGRLRRAHS
jgi:hypothetical protein